MRPFPNGRHLYFLLYIYIYIYIYDYDDGDDDGEVGGMNGFGRGNRSTRRKHAPTPLCPSQIPLDRPPARTRAAAVGSQRLTALAMASIENVAKFMCSSTTATHRKFLEEISADYIRVMLVTSHFSSAF
jgi:hypothetical protein